MATKRTGKKKTIQVDFTGVESGGGKLLPEERFKFEIEDIEEKKSDSDNDYLAFTFSVVEGEYEGTKAWDNFSLQPQALWKLRGLLEALGQEVPDGVMDLDTSELIGLVVGGDIIHEEYKKKPKHRIATYMPVDEVDADTAPTPAPSAAKKKSPAKKEDDAPTWEKKQKVSFKDGKKTLTGVITEIDGDQITVKVGSDEYEVDAGDLEAA